MLTSCILPSLMKMNEGILPRRSSNVWSFTAALVDRHGVQGNTDRHKSMVVESNAETGASSSRTAFALDNVLRAITLRKPRWYSLDDCARTQASISRRLSRQVSCANAKHRY